MLRVLVSQVLSLMRLFSIPADFGGKIRNENKNTRLLSGAICSIYI